MFVSFINVIHFKKQINILKIFRRPRCVIKHDKTFNLRIIESYDEQQRKLSKQTESKKGVVYLLILRDFRQSWFICKFF